MDKSASKSAVHRQPSGRIDDLSIRNAKFQKLLLALHSATEAKAFLKAAEQIIHAAIPCDVVHTLLHYSVDRGSSSVAWGSDGSVFTNEHVRASLEGNPITWLLAARPGVRFQPLEMCYASSEQMKEDPFFKRFILGIGVQHATAMPFAGGDLIFAPQRASGRGEFTCDEMAIMETLHPHIDAAYRRVNRLQTESGALLGLEQCMTPLPLPTVLLDWDLAPFFFNPSGQEAIEHWRGANPHLKIPSGLPQLPADLLGALRTMREQWTIDLRDGCGTATLPEHVVEHPKEPGCRARISMTTLRSPHFGKPSFVVRFEHAHPGRSEKLAAIIRLTASERKLLDRVLDGESNQEIADAIGRSVNTIKSSLHEIFTKLGIHSRARLIARFR